MEKICYTAIFGQYEDLKPINVVTPGWKYVVFTDQPLTSNIWQVIHVERTEETDTLQARMVKLTAWQLLDCEYSMWVDGSFTINCNLNDWWNQHFKAPFTCIQHPIRDCVYREAEACIKHGRGSVEQITPQIEKYRRVGLPAHNGIIQSGILMRQNTPEVQKICQAWFEEVLNESTRDQLAFAYVCWKHNFQPNTFKWDYRTAQEFQFLTHFHRRKRPGSF